MAMMHCMRDIRFLGLAFTVLAGAHAAHGAHGSWTGAANAMWTNNANWSGSSHPTTSQTATFNGAGNGFTTLDISGLASVRTNIFTSAGVAPYTLGVGGPNAQTLVMDNNGLIRVTADAGAPQMIHAALCLGIGASAGSYTFQNDSVVNTLTIAGDIFGASSAATPGAKTINIRGAGDVVLSGSVSDGNGAGGKLNVNMAGTLTLAGSNAFNGGDNEFYSGSIRLTHPQALEGTGRLLARTPAPGGKIEFAHDGPEGTQMQIASGWANSTWNTFTLVSGTGSGNVGINHTVDSVSISGTTVTVVRAAHVTAGTPSITIQTAIMNGLGVEATLNPLTADLFIGDSMNTGGDALRKTLVLGGLTVGNRVNGVIGNGVGTVSFRKEGASTWTLLGANTYTGETAVTEGTLLLSGANGAFTATAALSLSGGSLILDNTTDANANRIADGAPVRLEGGEFRFAHNGGAADYAETAGALTVASGAGTVHAARAAAGQTSALTFASLAYEGGSVDFTGEGLGADGRNRILFATPPVLNGGIIGPWATVNGTHLATYGANGIEPYTPSGTVDIAARGPNSEIPDDSGAHVRIVSDGTSGAITLAGGDTSVASLTQSNATFAATVDTAGKTLRAGTVGVEAGAAALTLGLAAGDGTLTALGAGGTVSLVNNAASPLVVNAAVADNGAASSLFKFGTGTAVLNGPYTYTGQTVIDAGELVFAGAAAQTLASVVNGAGTFVKRGTNTLHLFAENSYTGPSRIEAGTVRVNSGKAFGTGNASVAIEAGATLDIGGAASADSVSFGAKPFIVSGVGSDGQGAIVNNSPLQQLNAFSRIALADDATFGGTAGIRLRYNNAELALNGHTLTKLGTNIVDLYDARLSPGVGGGVDFREGRFRLSADTRLEGGAEHTLSVAGGATFEFYQSANAPAWTLALADGATVGAANSSNDRQNRWDGPVTLAGGNVLLAGGNSTYVLNIAGDISGDGGITKGGQPYVHLSGTNNTYTGQTAVVRGRLYAAAVRNIGEPSSLGQPMTAEAGRVALGAGADSGALVYTGTGDTTDRVIAMGGSTGGANIYHEGTGPLTFTSDLDISVAGTKSLQLRGTSSSLAEFTGNIIPAAGVTVNVSKDESGTWNLSGTNRFSGTLTVNNGTLILSGSNSVANTLQVQAAALTVAGELHGGSTVCQVNGTTGGNGILRLLPGATMTGSGNFSIGRASGTCGAFHMDGGTFIRNTATDDAERFALGFQSGGYGYLRQGGGELTATRLQIGSTGAGNGMGIVRVAEGTFRCPGTFHISRAAGSIGVLTLEGGVIDRRTPSTFIQMGYQGGRGEFNLTGGTLLNDTEAIHVRYNSGNATGIVNMCAGTLALREFRITSPGIGWLNLQGGTLRATVNTTAFIPSAWTGAYAFGPRDGFAGGAVIDTDGHDVSIAKPIQAPHGDGVQAITLSGQGSGYIGEPYVSIEGGGGAGACAVANMEDDGTGRGTYKVASITVTSPGVGYTEPPTVTFLRGGNGIVAATVASVTLAPNTSGGLTKLGTGTLTLGAANTYTGATTVLGGTLKLGNAQALPPNTEIILDGGALDMNGYAGTNGISGTGAVRNGTLRATLSPAGAGVLGTNSLTLVSATLEGSTYIADVAADGASDLVAVEGDLDISGLTLQLVNPALLDRRQTYTLLSCSGTLSGSLASANLPDSRWHVTGLSGGKLRLVFMDGLIFMLR